VSQRGPQAPVIEAALIWQFAAAARLTNIGSPQQTLGINGYCRQRWTERTMRISPIPFSLSRRREQRQEIPSIN
jgi:hypothetical protein